MIRSSLLAPLLVLLFWGTIKIPWETRLYQTEISSRFQNYSSVRQVRDQLGQGMMLGLLSGFRAVVANYLWMKITDYWSDRQWYRIQASLDLITSLQPRTLLFWDMGSWHLCWNASKERRNNPDEPNLSRRLKEERYWVESGIEFLQRGIANNPDRYLLWLQMAWIYERRLSDDATAAIYYAEAAKRPDAPVYVERFVGYALEKSGQDEKAYAYWKTLWEKNKDTNEKPRGKDKIEERIRHLETKLNIPIQHRIFK